MCRESTPGSHQDSGTQEFKGRRNQLYGLYSNGSGGDQYRNELHDDDYECAYRSHSPLSFRR